MKQSKTLTYTYSILTSIFAVCGYAIIMDDFQDPFVLIGLLSMVPVILIVVILSDIALSYRNDTLNIPNVILSGVLSFCLVGLPLMGYVDYAASDFKEKSSLSWKKQDWDIVSVAIAALKDHPDRTSDIGLAQKSLVYFSETDSYRVIFAYRGYELAEVYIKGDGKTVQKINVH